MSLSFDGVDDVVASDATQTFGTLFSIGAWINPVSAGEGNLGRIAENGASGSGERFSLFWNGTADKKLAFFSRWNPASPGIWEMAAGFAAFAGWKWVMATYDAGDTANNPTLYTLDGSTFSVLTVGSGLTETATPAGSIPADNTTFYVGNSSDTSNTFDGLIGEQVLYKRILSEAEARAVAFLGVNAVPDHFNYLPFDPTAQNLGSSATAFTITGAVASANPPIKPAGRRG